MVKAEATTAAGGAHFATAVLLSNNRHTQAHQRSDIGGQGAVGTGDQDHIVFTSQAGHHLRNARIFGTRHGFYPAEQSDFLGAVERGNGV